MAVETISWVVVGLVVAVVLIAISTNMAVDIGKQEFSVETEEQLIQALRDCWRREPVQDCYIVEIKTTISEPAAGVPVEWRATSGKVKISREADRVVVSQF